MAVAKKVYTFVYPHVCTYVREGNREVNDKTLKHIAMKNLWKMMLAVLVMLCAVACEVGIDEPTPNPNQPENPEQKPDPDPDPTPEPEPTPEPGDITLSFEATIRMDADETRTDLEFNDGTGLWDTVWSGGEVLVVTAADKAFEFVNSAEEKSIFSCNAKGVEVLEGADVAIALKHAKSGAIDSKAGKSGGSLSAEVKAFDTKEVVTLDAATTFLRYKSGFEVTISATENIFVYDGAEHNSVTLAAGNDVWVAILNVDKAVTLTCRVADERVFEKEYTFASHKVYNLGEIKSTIFPDPTPEPEPDPTPEPGDANTIYFVPGVWNVDGAWFVAHVWGDGVDAVDVKLTDDNADGVYECQVAQAMTGIIFCRMNPKYTDFSWNSETEADHVWNQTQDLTIGVAPTNCYYITDWEKGEWREVGSQPSDPGVTPGGSSDYGVVGSFQGWDVAAPVAMAVEQDGWLVARGVELYKDDEIKIVKGNTWDESYGLEIAAVLTTDAEHALVKNAGGNVKVAKNGKFDISFNAATSKFKYTCTEEYTNLTVNITINNKAGWNPLRLILKSGDTFITAAEGDVIEGNSYAISGDYIGSSLTYQFLTDGKQGEEASVTITKSGAVLTLDENVIKLTFMLDTDNAKQWWGETAKIHVWGTGTSFDTSWPGNNMTYDGNHTWHINVPSELVGKTINFLVHNGNNWQSKDSTVAITASGATVTGSSIGIN